MRRIHNRFLIVPCAEPESCRRDPSGAAERAWGILAFAACSKRLHVLQTGAVAPRYAGSGLETTEETLSVALDNTFAPVPLPPFHKPPSCSPRRFSYSSSSLLQAQTHLTSCAPGGRGRTAQSTMDSEPSAKPNCSTRAPTRAQSPLSTGAAGRAREMLEHTTSRWAIGHGYARISSSSVRDSRLLRVRPAGRGTDARTAPLLGRTTSATPCNGGGYGFDSEGDCYGKFWSVCLGLSSDGECYYLAYYDDCAE